MDLPGGTWGQEGLERQRTWLLGVEGAPEDGQRVLCHGHCLVMQTEKTLRVLSVKNLVSISLFGPSV